jgi:hypothetical protein
MDKIGMELGSKMLNSMPVVGYAKAIVHFACGDKEGGYKALVSATRSFALSLAGQAAKNAGPVGAVVAAVGTGTCYDLIAANLSGGKHVNGVARIGADHSCWANGGIEILGDVVCGMSFVVDVNNEPWKSIMKHREEKKNKIHVKDDIFLWGLLIRAAGSVDQGPSHIFGRTAFG